VLLVLRDRVEKDGHPASGRILVYPVADRLLRGLENFGWAILVGESLPEIDGTSRNGESRHFRKNGWSQLTVTAEQHRATSRTLPSAADCHGKKISLITDRSVACGQFVTEMVALR
jgi:hypothetical protein